jgi:prevent-host-death family protein
METVTHREMRNHSGEILRRVEAGESVRVTNNGRVAALIVPPGRDPLTDLAERGQLRPALRDVRTLRDINRRSTRHTSEQIVADTRGQW